MSGSSLSDKRGELIELLRWFYSNSITDGMADANRFADRIIALFAVSHEAPTTLPWPLSEYAERMKAHVDDAYLHHLYALVEYAQSKPSATATSESPERQQAIELASRTLDRVSADPDDDLAVLARQFLRAIEHPVKKDGQHIARNAPIKKG